MSNRYLDVPDAEAAVDDLSLRDSHVVVVHLLVAHLPVDVQRVRGFAQHLEEGRFRATRMSLLSGQAQLNLSNGLPRSNPGHPKDEKTNVETIFSALQVVEEKASSPLQILDIVVICGFVAMIRVRIPPDTFFDLKVNRLSRVCSQYTASKALLADSCFHIMKPIITNLETD